MKKNEKLNLKIFAIVFAAILWSYVMTEVNPKVTKEFKNVQVTLINLEDINRKELLIMEPIDPKITVKLTGNRNTMNQITSKDIIVEVDLKGYGDNTQMIPITIKPPEDTTLSYASERTLLFRFEKKISKQLNVDIATINALPSNNFILMHKTASPNVITIEGPSSKVNSVQSAQVTVDLTNIHGDTQLNLPIILRDFENNEVKDLTMGQSFANVSLTIRLSKEVPIKLLTVNQVATGIQLIKQTVSPNKITVTGSNEALENLIEISTKPVDLSQIREDTNVTLELVYPEGVIPLDPGAKFLANFDVDS